MDEAETLFTDSGWTQRPLFPSLSGRPVPTPTAPPVSRETQPSSRNARPQGILVPAETLQALQAELHRLRQQLLDRDKQAYELQLAQEASNILVNELQQLLESRQQLQKQQSELLQENQLLWVERYLMSQQLGVDATNGSSLVQAVQEAVQADVQSKRRQRLKQHGIAVRAAALGSFQLHDEADSLNGFESANVLASESSGHLDDEPSSPCTAAVGACKLCQATTLHAIPWRARQAPQRSASSENLLSARLSCLHVSAGLAAASLAPGNACKPRRPLPHGTSSVGDLCLLANLSDLHPLPNAHLDVLLLAPARSEPTAADVLGGGLKDRLSAREAVPVPDKQQRSQCSNRHVQAAVVAVGRSDQDAPLWQASAAQRLQPHEGAPAGVQGLLLPEHGAGAAGKDRAASADDDKEDEHAELQVPSPSACRSWQNTWEDEATAAMGRGQS